ncbi:ABC transporter ATP-binding protein [Propionivibrio dicarboxylicus]|uniref:Putative ABC transport system ATP-binding protein n=1 Tax=Propionivibrio dicarboxylicus TaxID=83767 RepID=A0A1G8ESP8_9RHOO|nr:ABC transporter ATP-binding protein [Propionivibrio dicarboxylicus]SDH72885.1 putative ABC transport system ATP-binding protein [Propionivibrio dicarboxylicus]
MRLEVQGAYLQLRDLSMLFAGQTTPLFHIEELDIPPGSSVGISGPSGAGKTTLFHCLAGITLANQGTVSWDGVDISRLPGDMRDRWRRQNLGLIFQDFHLIDGLSALNNVLLPAYFASWRPATDLRRRAHALLEAAGLDSSVTDRDVSLLSRGERQRVAFARALLCQPKIIMADEPTASLDPDHRGQVGDLLLDLARSHGTTVLVISHEQELLVRMDRCLTLRDGVLLQSANMASAVLERAL